MRADTTTPDTRLADDPMRSNPATVANLVRLTMGGLPTGNRTLVLHARLRYFDPDRRRPGLPADVAALVEGLRPTGSVSPSSTSVRSTTAPSSSRGGPTASTACGPSPWTAARRSRWAPVVHRGPRPRLRRLSVTMDRYATAPSLDFPWNAPAP